MPAATPAPIVETPVVSPPPNPAQITEELASGTQVDQEPPPPTAFGTVSVNVRGGWAEVYIDGQRIDTTPIYKHKLSVGPHTIEIVQGETGERKTRQINIFPNQNGKVTF